MKDGEVFLTGFDLPAGSDVYVYRHGKSSHYVIAGPPEVPIRNIFGHLLDIGDRSEELIGVLSKAVVQVRRITVDGDHLRGEGGEIIGLARTQDEVPDKPMIRRR